MNTMTKFANNPYYVQYERLLDELSRLMAEGKGETNQADAIRDEMDAPWYKLSQEEIDRLRGVSADLYMIQDEEVYEPYEGTQGELRTALSEALRRLDYETILSLLRKGTPFLKPAQVAALRGRCYAALGHLETGLLFMRYAAGHEPEQAAHSLYILSLLVRLSRSQEVLSELVQINRTQEALSEVESYARSVIEPLPLAA